MSHTNKHKPEEINNRLSSMHDVRKYLTESLQYYVMVSASFYSN